MGEFLTVGPWGGIGGNHWSFVQNKGGIIEMEIHHGDAIDSISFKCGDEYGVHQQSMKVGGNGGHITKKVHICWYYSVSLIKHFCESRN